MPAPSVATTKTEFSPSFTVEGGFATSIDIGSDFCINLSDGFVNGWTAAAPTTASTFETEIALAFGALDGASAGLGWLTSVGQELDAEVDLWIAGWDGDNHLYTPSASAIVARITGTSSAATTKLNQVVTDWFITNFTQEGA